MLEIFREKDVDKSFLAGKTIAVIGYGNQGRAQALNMRDSGLQVIVGSRKGKSFDKAVQDGFEAMSVRDASAKADVIHILLPDEVHGEVYASDIAPVMTQGKTLSCSHGFNIVFRQIVPPSDVDVIMVSPKGAATGVREYYEKGFGVPGLVAIEQDCSGNAFKTALAMADALGFTRAGVFKCTFAQETNEDLFGEQNVLCGGIVDLMKYAFEVLTEAGYPPEMAYFEVIHEIKIITDLLIAKGFSELNHVISNTAEFGEYVNGPRIITPDVKERMKESLKRIESGEFAREFIAERKNGFKFMEQKRREMKEHLAEKTGVVIRDIIAGKR